MVAKGKGDDKMENNHLRSTECPLGMMKMFWYR